VGFKADLINNGQFIVRILKNKFNTLSKKWVFISRKLEYRVGGKNIIK